jgi:hypothetical protein
VLQAEDLTSGDLFSSCAQFFARKLLELYSNLIGASFRVTASPSRLIGNLGSEHARQKERVVMSMGNPNGRP